MYYYFVCFVDMWYDHVEQAGQDLTVLCLCHVRTGVARSHHHTQLANTDCVDLGAQVFSGQLLC